MLSHNPASTFLLGALAGASLTYGFLKIKEQINYNPYISTATRNHSISGPLAEYKH